MDIKEYLKKKRISQADLAREMKVTRGMIHLIVAGKCKVPISRLAQFEKLTGIPREKFRPELYR